MLTAVALAATGFFALVIAGAVRLAFPRLGPPCRRRPRPCGQRGRGVTPVRTLTKVTVAAIAVTAVAGYSTSHVPARARPGEAPVRGPGEAAFIQAVLTDLHAPATSANVASVEAWVRHETSWPPAAANNPLNSTLPEPGSTVFNTITLAGGGVIHVQNYPDAAEGAAATAATIANGNYPHITAGLDDGTGLCADAAAAADFATWSGNGYSAVC
jgi:hypothetical protein